MGERVAQVAEFPDYCVTDHGRVLKAHNWREMKITYTQGGIAKVGFVRDGKQHWRSVSKLVADSFVDGYSEDFNTPILFDNDPRNLVVENITWRPRWFALAYRKQFDKANLYSDVGPIVDITTGEQYATLEEVCRQNGLLINGTFARIANNEPVYPTNQIFAFYK